MVVIVLVVYWDLLQIVQKNKEFYRAKKNK